MVKLSKQQMNECVDVECGPFRLVWENLFTPDEHGKYRVSLTVPKSSKTLIETLRRAEEKAGTALFGDDFDVDLHSNIRDADEKKNAKKWAGKEDSEGDPYLQDCWVLSAKSSKPCIVIGEQDGKRFRITEGGIKSGDYVMAVLKPWPYSNESDGVTWLLNGVMLVKEGTAISNVLTDDERAEQLMSSAFQGVPGAGKQTSIKESVAVMAQDNDWI